MAHGVKTWALGPDWKTLNLRDEADAHAMALVATGARLDRGAVEGIEPPADVEGALATVRGIAWHDAATVLEWAGSGFYVNGVRAVKADGTTLTIAGTGPIRPTRDGHRTYFTDGAGVVRWYDKRDTSAAPICFEDVLPATPGDPTHSTAEIPSKTVHALTNATEHRWPDTDDGLEEVTGFHVVGSAHLDSHGWTKDGFGVPTPRINTDANSEAGDGWYFDYGAGTKPDWSDATALTFQILPDASGTYLAFVFGEDAIDTAAPYWGGQGIVFPCPTANAVNTITVRLPNTSTEDRGAIQWWGFYVLNNQQFTANWKALEYVQGTVGRRDYALTLRKTVGAGDAATVFRSQENKSLTGVDAGTKGSKVTITFAAAVPAGHVLEVWRRDEGISPRYLLAGTAAEGANTYEDTSADVSDGLVLKEGRVAPPSGAQCVFSHRGRLGLVLPGWVWLSGIGDPTLFFDVTPEQVIDLTAASDGYAFTDGDPIKLPMPVPGAALAAHRFGITTAEQFRSDTLLLTDEGWSVLLEGGTIHDLSLAQSRPGGTCGVYASALLKDNRVAVLDPDGDLVAWNARLDFERLSDLVKPAWTASSAAVVVADHVTDRLAVFAGGAFCLDAKAGGWVQMDATAVGTPVAAALRMGTDGGHAVITDGTGRRRLFDPAGTPAGWIYETSDWNTLPQEWNAVRVWPETSGDVTVTLYVDGAVVDSWLSDGAPRKLPTLIGQRFRLRFEGEAGSKLYRVETWLAPRRR